MGCNFWPFPFSEFAVLSRMGAISFITYDQLRREKEVVEDRAANTFEQSATIPR